MWHHVLSLPDSGFFFRTMSSTVPAVPTAAEKYATMSSSVAANGTFRTKIVFALSLTMSRRPSEGAAILCRLLLPASPSSRRALVRALKFCSL